MDVVAVLPSREASDLAPTGGLGRSASSPDLLYGVPPLPLPSMPVFVILVCLATVGCVASVAFVLSRRGRGPSPSAALGTAVGPAHPGWALPVGRSVHEAASGGEAQAGRCQDGDVTVLVAVLGEPTAVADVSPVLRSLGGRLGHVTLVRPVGLDRADEGWVPAQEAATRVLSQAALFVSGPSPDLIPIPGEGESAVARVAAARPVDVVVLVGDPGAEPDQCRSPELWNCTILVVAGSPGDDSPSR